MNQKLVTKLILSAFFVLGAGSAYAVQCTGSAVPSASCGANETMHPSCSCNSTCQPSGSWYCADSATHQTSSGSCVNDANSPCKFKKHIQAGEVPTVENGITTDPIVSNAGAPISR